MTQVMQTIRNGVDTQQMYGTLDAIKAEPTLGAFQFRASSQWIDGAHNRTTIQRFYGAGQEDSSREEPFVLDAGEPAVLLGADTGANPAEALLHALAACLTTSIVYVAAARKVQLTSVESTLTGDMDVRGALGACLTTSLVYVAAARKVRLTYVESTLEGNMDVRGALGISDDVRNGFTDIRVTFTVKGDAPEPMLREVVARAQQRSAVFDIVTNGVPVAVEIATH